MKDDGGKVLVDYGEIATAFLTAVNAASVDMLDGSFSKDSCAERTSWLLEDTRHESSPPVIAAAYENGYFGRDWILKFDDRPDLRPSDVGITLSRIVNVARLKVEELLKLFGPDSTLGASFVVSPRNSLEKPQEPA